MRIINHDILRMMPSKQNLLKTPHLLTVVLIGLLLIASLMFVYKKCVYGVVLKTLALGSVRVPFVPQCAASTDTPEDVYFVSCGGVY